MHARRTRLLAIAPLLGLAVMACASSSTSAATQARTASIMPLTPTSRLIDRERIVRSAAQTALDAVRTFVPHSRLTGSPPSSWLTAPGMPRGMPRVLVDGHMVGDLESLRLIPARDVLAIHVLSGADATMRYGPNYEGGAIVVQTLAALRRLY